MRSSLECPSPLGKSHRVNKVIAYSYSRYRNQNENVPHFVRLKHVEPQPLCKIVGLKAPGCEIPFPEEISQPPQVPKMGQLIKEYIDMKLHQLSPDKYAESTACLIAPHRQTPMHLLMKSSDSFKDEIPVVRGLPQLVVPITDLSISYPYRDPIVKPVKSFTVRYANPTPENASSFHLPQFFHREDKFPLPINACVCSLQPDLDASSSLDAIKQLHLLHHTSRSPPPDLRCLHCGLPAQSWCPKCRSTFCFRCWPLAAHSETMTSADLLYTHFAAMRSTDSHFLTVEASYDPSREIRPLSRPARIEQLSPRHEKALRSIKSSIQTRCLSPSKSSRRLEAVTARIGDVMKTVSHHRLDDSAAVKGLLDDLHFRQSTELHPSLASASNRRQILSPSLFTVDAEDIAIEEHVRSSAVMKGRIIRTALR